MIELPFSAYDWLLMRRLKQEGVNAFFEEIDGESKETRAKRMLKF
jgi:hypothetical protein